MSPSATRQRALATVAGGAPQESQSERGPWTKTQEELIRRTFPRELGDDDLAVFMYTCTRVALDPLAKQIHAVARWNSRLNRHVMSIQTAIDGFRLIAARTGEYVGSSELEFGPEDDFGYPAWVKLTVYRLVHGKRASFPAIAFWREYYPGDQLGSFWRKMPHVMLGKCVEALALRKGFPAELSNLYVPEEMDQAATGGDSIVQDVEYVEQEPRREPPPEERRRDPDPPRQRREREPEPRREPQRREPDPPPRREPDPPPRRAPEPKRPPTTEERADAFWKYLVYEHGEEAALSILHKVSSFYSPQTGKDVCAQTWKGLARSDKWLDATINAYNQRFEGDPYRGPFDEEEVRG